MKQAVPIFFGSLLLLTACSDDDNNNNNNAPPTAVDDSVSVDTGVESSIDVLANDTDPDDDALEIVDVSDPENGTASIDGSVILYTPVDSFLGTDTFTYTMTDGESEASAEVTVTVQDTVSISGKIVDKVIPDATVTVTVGGETYTTTSNADGDYTLDVSFTQGEELLIINAKGSESNNQDFVELVSTLPSLNSLKSKAGDDGILDSNEAFGTNVTNVTTASYALMLDANDGETPADDEALSMAQEAIDANELLEMSAVIKMVIDEGRKMPEGNKSTLDFVKKKKAFKEEVEKIKQENPNAIGEMISQIASDKNLVPQKTEANLPSFYIPTAATVPGFVSKSSEVLVFNEDGTGKSLAVPVNSDPGAKNTFTWKLQNNGFYKIVYDTPRTHVSFPMGAPSWATDEVKAACRDNQVYTEFTYEYIEFKVLVEGQSVDTVRKKAPYKQTITTDLCETDSGSYTKAVDAEADSQAYLNGDGMTLIPLNKSDVEGTWAMNVLGQYAEENNNRFIPDMVTFGADGSLSSLYAGVSGTWELTDSGTIILMYDGYEQTVVMYDKINGLYGSLMTVKDANGPVAGYYGRVVKDDPEVTVTAEDLYTEADEFWFGHINSWMRPNWNEDADLPTVDQYWGWQFKSPNEAFNVRLVCDLPEDVFFCEHGVTTQRVAADQLPGWQVKESGKVVQIDRVNGGNSGDLVRRWHVLDITDDGWMYVLEFDFYDQVADSTDDISVLGGAYNRINMMDVTKFPDGLSH
ncbi:UNVERIFIED_ORG: hypothetical protein DFO82_1525 [Idiomarina abyssalis]|jgi:hypothetical protein|uniref:Ig-like domain-containing protein n=1 Tax=Idiomarina sp. 017G TaxID=2183988 RepID=UPI000E0ED3A4|nr:Ig-like domain-containing protein [Idiomarina sp. 017G]TDO50209.1 hypothetical protein DEU30_10463 [Idiomarina sp. 017G]